MPQRVAALGRERSLIRFWHVRQSRRALVIGLSLLLVSLGSAVQFSASAQSSAGSFSVENYATGSSTGGFFKRGYIFEVTQTTVVTGLSGAGTSGSTFAVGLYTATTTANESGDLYSGGSTTPTALVGSIKFTGGEANGTTVSKSLATPVTLQPGNIYLLAQMRLGTAGGGSHSTVTGLNHANILSHPRIKRWGPSGTQGVYYWGHAMNEESFIGRTSTTDSNLPRLGILFQSDCELPTVVTQTVSISGNEITFTGNLTGTGASGTQCATPPVELAFEEGTSEDLARNGRFANATPSSATTPGEFTLTLTGLSPNTTYYYRAVAINEAGRSSGEIKSFTFTPAPQVGAPTLVDRTATSFDVSSELVSLGTSDVTAHGLCIEKVGPDICVDLAAASQTGPFTTTFEDLTANTSYQVYAYATNTSGRVESSRTTLTTALLAQTISFGPIDDRSLGDVDFDVEVSTSAGLPPTLAASPANVCTSSSSQGVLTVTIEGAGLCTLTATQAGNGTYAPATPVAQTFNISKQTQTVLFPAPHDRIYSISSFPLAASATSGLHVSFASATPNVCTVNGLNAQSVIAGTCTITASQAGNRNLVAAEPVTRSFEITKASAQIWFRGGLVRVLPQDGLDVLLPDVAVKPGSVGTLIVDWHDGRPPTAAGRFRVNLTFESDTHQATPIATFVSVIAPQSLPQNMPPPAIGPVMGRAEDGEPVVPVKSPSAATVKRDDQPVTSTVTRPTTTRVKIEEAPTQENGSGSVIEFATRSTRTADERPLAAEIDLVLLAGGVLDMSGSGYQNGTTVEVWMFSEPELLGVTTVAADGTFTDQFDVPASVAAGEHVIQLNGITASGQLVSTSMGVLAEVPASNDDPTPLRVGAGPLLTATSRGPAGMVGATTIDMRTEVVRPRSLLGRSQDVLVVSHDDDTGGFGARLTPHANDGFGAVTANSIVLSHDAHVEGTVTGFAPFTSVHLWLLSEPRMLGRVITNQNGEATFRLSLPDDATFGRHSVQFVGTTTRGQTAGFAVGAWVVPDAPLFADVAFDMTHGAAITTLGVHGHVSGFSDGMFKPQATITRGHAATMMANLFGFDASDAKDMFTDTGGTTHGAGIAALAAAEVATGFANGTFQPDMAITRGQAAMLLSRLIKLEVSGNDSPVFSDIAGRNDTEAIRALHGAGLVAGFADGSFNPDAPITRAQFASLIVNAHYQHS